MQTETFMATASNPARDAFHRASNVCGFWRSQAISELEQELPNLVLAKRFTTLAEQWAGVADVCFHRASGFQPTTLEATLTQVKLAECLISELADLASTIG
jgi:hypothetical protein